jgi:hypothetical protein
MQNRPGDRIIFGEADAAALYDSAVGTLYGGLYQYVVTRAASTAAPTRARAAFWDTSVAGSYHQVTPDESGAQGTHMFAGVYINTLTRGYSWWIQCFGKVSVQFRAVLTGIPSDGCAVYLAAAGAGADVGEFDVLDGAGNPSFTQVSNMLNRYAGVAQGAPSDNGLTTINIPLGRMFRW